ncbi:Hypothetical_protein [Hexamita inflata]|uniref:Hypothetical_protein n=1 Tax=Hexamita inflata TaxID=28002 RepID=A0AA86QDA0_9EUKA|nr:Hypothetical protein HINF_LOCUS41757 [Hexamita inflata]
MEDNITPDTQCSSKQKQKNRKTDQQIDEILTQISRILTSLLNDNQPKINQNVSIDNKTEKEIILMYEQNRKAIDQHKKVIQKLALIMNADSTQVANKFYVSTLLPRCKQKLPEDIITKIIELAQQVEIKNDGKKELYKIIKNLVAKSKVMVEYNIIQLRQEIYLSLLKPNPTQKTLTFLQYSDQIQTIIKQYECKEKCTSVNTANKCANDQELIQDYEHWQNQ